MPLYDYRCSECGTEVEVMHAIDGSGPTDCDVCGGSMRKALSSPAIHFKGSGWAKKDARSAARKSSSSTSDGETAPASKTGEGKSDAGDAKSSDAKSIDRDTPKASTPPASSAPASSTASTKD